MEELMKLLENTEDKFAILNDIDFVSKYQIIERDFLKLTKQFLSDAERFKLLDNEFIASNKALASSIIISIHDDEIVSQILDNEALLANLSDYDVAYFIEKAGDVSKTKVIYNSDFIKKYNIPSFKLPNFILSLSDESKISMLNDLSMLKDELHLPDFKIAEIIMSLHDDDQKIEFSQKCDLKEFQKTDIICTIDDSKKSDILLGENDFNKHYIQKILASMNVDALADFLSEHKEILKEHSIMPCKLVSALTPEKQKLFLDHIENLGFCLNEKREVFALLSNSIKADLDTSKYPPEYKTAISLMNNSSVYLEVDFSKDPTDYIGLDRILHIEADTLDITQQKYLFELCNICPNMRNL